MFFMAYPGPGHEEFQIEKLVGFVLVILGVLFFEQILAFDENYRIVYRDDDEDEDNEADSKVEDEVTKVSSEQNKPVEKRALFSSQQKNKNKQD